MTHADAEEDAMRDTDDAVDRREADEIRVQDDDTPEDETVRDDTVHDDTVHETAHAEALREGEMPLADVGEASEPSITEEETRPIDESLPRDEAVAEEGSRSNEDSTVEAEPREEDQPPRAEEESLEETPAETSLPEVARTGDESLREEPQAEEQPSPT